MARKDRRSASSRSKSGSNADGKSLAGASDRSNNTADTGAASRAEDVLDILNYNAATSKPRSTTTGPTQMVTSRATYAAFGNDAFDATEAAATTRTTAPAGQFDADALLRLLGDDATKTTKTTATTTNVTRFDARDERTTTSNDIVAAAAANRARGQIPVDIASNNGSNDADGDAAAPEYSFMFVGKDNTSGGGGAVQNAMSGGYSGVADVGSPGSVAGANSADADASRARRTRRAMELRAEALRAAGVDIDASGEASAGSGGSIWRSAAGARTTVPPVYPPTPQQQPSGGSTYDAPTSPGSVERRTPRRSGGAAVPSSARSDSSSDSRLRLQYQQGDAEEIQSLKEHRQGNLFRLIASLANAYLSAVTGFKVVPTYPLNRRITRCVVGEGLSM